MYAVVTGRFNNETLGANYMYRAKHNFACMYCSPMELSPKIPYDTPVFVIEMNNATNKVEGIGLIKNRPDHKKYYKVHSEGNTNRHIYIGNRFINRDIIEYYNASLLAILEKLLFTGKTHSKRGSGLSLLPHKWLLKENCDGLNIKKEIKELFECHFREKEKE